MDADTTKKTVPEGTVLVNSKEL